VPELIKHGILPLRKIFKYPFILRKFIFSLLFFREPDENAPGGLPPANKNLVQTIFQMRLNYQDFLLIVLMVQLTPSASWWVQR